MKSSRTLSRSGKAPRTALILAALVVAAMGALFLVSRQASSPDLILGGPLLDLENTTVDGFLLTRNGGQYRFDKNDAGYWTLRGGVVDFVDQKAMVLFLKKLGEGQGGRLMAGTEIEDRRYDFNGPSALRLTVFTVDGRQQKLAIGAGNPVTGNFYASGVGRAGCFPVSEFFQSQLAGLPASLQLPQLMPKFDRQIITKVELWFGTELHVLQVIDGRWWFRQPAAGLGSWGESARAYHQFYSDRMKIIDGETWLLANKDAVQQVIYEASETIIKDFPNPRSALARLQEWDLDPPWRRVKLYGPHINPDSTETASNELEITLGMVMEGQRVPALRRGNVLITDNEALTSLSGSLSKFLDVGAISFLVAECDSMWGKREGTLLVQAVRGDEPVIQPGTQKRPAVESWLTVYPAKNQMPDMRQISYNGIARNLIVNLDRLEILKVLPSTNNRQVLSEKERVVFEIHGHGAVVNLEFGYLAEENISESLVVTGGGQAPVGMWRSDTGQLLQVPGHVVVTMRSLMNSMKTD